MSLKAYSFTRTDEKGTVEDCYITFDSQSLNWDDKGFYVSFKNYPSQSTSGASIMRLGKELPEKINPRGFFTLRLLGDAFLAEAMQPIEENAIGLPFLLYFSNRIWNMAFNTPFISDFSVADVHGNLMEVVKSLSELKAEIHEIPFG